MFREIVTNYLFESTYRMAIEQWNKFELEFKEMRLEEQSNDVFAIVIECE